MGFDISVDDAVTRQIVNRLQNLVHNESNLSLRQSVLVEIHLEVTSRYLFHDDINIGLTFKNLLDFDYVLVRYRTPNLYLFSQPPFPMISQIWLMNLFNRNYFLRSFIAALEHC